MAAIDFGSLLEQSGFLKELKQVLGLSEQGSFNKLHKVERYSTYFQAQVEASGRREMQHPALGKDQFSPMHLDLFEAWDQPNGSKLKQAYLNFCQEITNRLSRIWKSDELVIQSVPTFRFGFPMSHTVGLTEHMFAPHPGLKKALPEKYSQPDRKPHYDAQSPEKGPVLGHHEHLKNIWIALPDIQVYQQLINGLYLDSNPLRPYYNFVSPLLNSGQGLLCQCATQRHFSIRNINPDHSRISMDIRLSDRSGFDKESEVYSGKSISKDVSFNYDLNNPYDGSPNYYFRVWKKKD